jgi:hypothetical protein
MTPAWLGVWLSGSWAGLGCPIFDDFFLRLARWAVYKYTRRATPVRTSIPFTATQRPQSSNAPFIPCLEAAEPRLRGAFAVV